MQKQRKPFSLMAFIRPHRAGFITSTVLAVLSVTSGMIPYFAVARMVNLLISGEKNFSIYLTWGAVALIAYLLKSVLHGISTRCSHEATFHVLSELRRAVADKLTRVSMGYLTNTPSGRLKTTMVERVEQMEVPLAHIIPEMTSNLLVPVAIVVYLFLLDWRMALVSLITIPIGMLCYMAQMKEYPKKYGAVVQASKHMSATTVEYIGGIEVIKAFNQSAASYGKFTQAVRQSADLMLDWMKSTQGYSALMMTIWPAVLIGVLPIGCVFYRNGSLTAPDFITIAILSLGIVGPLVAAIFLTDDFSKIATITGEIGAVLSEPDLERPAQRKELQKERGMVRSVDVARHMGVSKPSVCHAVATLKAGGFLTMDEDFFLRLTDVGREVAEQTYEKHCFFTRLLIEAGVEPRIAEQDACRMEHVISESSFRHLKQNMDKKK